MKWALYEKVDKSCTYDFGCDACSQLASSGTTVVIAYVQYASSPTFFSFMASVSFSVAVHEVAAVPLVMHSPRYIDWSSAALN